MPWGAKLDDAFGPLVPGEREVTHMPKVQSPMDRPKPSLQGQEQLVIADSTMGHPEAPSIENTIEFAKANEHVKNSVFSPNLPRIPVTYKTPPFHQMETCEDFRVHLRNCPGCLAYMQQLMKDSDPQRQQTSGLAENFLNMFDNKNNDPLVDIIAIIGIGVLIIFVLDSFVRLGRSLRA